MSKCILDRRLFLRSAATTAAVVVAGTGGAAILASNRAWAMELSTFGQHEAEVLLAMTRQLYPHDSIGDIYYAEVVEALDQKAAAKPELVELVKNGVAALDQARHVPFLRLSPGTQTEVLEGMAGRLGENEATLREALAQIQMAFVQLKDRASDSPANT